MSASLTASAAGGIFSAGLYDTAALELHENIRTLRIDEARALMVKVWYSGRRQALGLEFLLLNENASREQRLEFALADEVATPFHLRPEEKEYDLPDYQTRVRNWATIWDLPDVAAQSRSWMTKMLGEDRKRIAAWVRTGDYVIDHGRGYLVTKITEHEVSARLNRGMGSYGSSFSKSHKDYDSGFALGFARPILVAVDGRGGYLALGVTEKGELLIADSEGLKVHSADGIRSDDKGLARRTAIENLLQVFRQYRQLGIVRDAHGTPGKQLIDFIPTLERFHAAGSGAIELAHLEAGAAALLPAVPALPTELKTSLVDVLSEPTDGQRRLARETGAFADHAVLFYRDPGLANETRILAGAAYPGYSSQSLAEIVARAIESEPTPNGTLGEVVARYPGDARATQLAGILQSLKTAASPNRISEAEMLLRGFPELPVALKEKISLLLPEVSPEMASLVAAAPEIREESLIESAEVQVPRGAVANHVAILTQYFGAHRTEMRPARREVLATHLRMLGDPRLHARSGDGFRASALRLENDFLAGFPELSAEVRAPAVAVLQALGAAPRAQREDEVRTASDHPLFHTARERAVVTIRERLGLLHDLAQRLPGFFEAKGAFVRAAAPLDQLIHSRDSRPLPEWEADASKIGEAFIRSLPDFPTSLRTAALGLVDRPSAELSVLAHDEPRHAKGRGSFLAKTITSEFREHYRPWSADFPYLVVREPRLLGQTRFVPLRILEWNGDAVVAVTPTDWERARTGRNHARLYRFDIAKVNVDIFPYAEDFNATPRREPGAHAAWSADTTKVWLNAGGAETQERLRDAARAWSEGHVRGTAMVVGARGDCRAIREFGSSED